MVLNIIEICIYAKLQLLIIIMANTLMCQLCTRYIHLGYLKNILLTIIYYTCYESSFISIATNTVSHIPKQPVVLLNIRASIWIEFESVCLIFYKMVICAVIRFSNRTGRVKYVFSAFQPLCVTKEIRCFPSQLSDVVHG